MITEYGEPCFKMQFLSPRWGILDLAISTTRHQLPSPIPTHHTTTPHHTPPPSTTHTHLIIITPSQMHSSARQQSYGGGFWHNQASTTSPPHSHLPSPLSPPHPPFTLSSHTFLTRRDAQFCAICHSTTQPHHHTDTYIILGGAPPPSSVCHTWPSHLPSNPKPPIQIHPVATPCVPYTLRLTPMPQQHSIQQQPQPLHTASVGGVLPPCPTTFTLPRAFECTYPAPTH
jgi:hypothetical protein